MSCLLIFESTCIAGFMVLSSALSLDLSSLNARRRWYSTRTSPQLEHLDQDRFSSCPCWRISSWTFVPSLTYRWSICLETAHVEAIATALRDVPDSLAVITPLLLCRKPSKLLMRVEKEGKRIN